MTLPKLVAGSPENPEPFGKFRLMGLIARGGMAEVYRARIAAPAAHEPDIVAIKVMRPEIFKEARFVDMFRREGKLAMLLSTDTIVNTFECGEIDGRPYIAMEYIGGKDLTQVLRKCQKTNDRIPIPHAVFIGSCIADGLTFAHNVKDDEGKALQLVNRDVSPSNVRVAYTGDVKMLDFGIAQALMKFTSEIGILKGKFSYMSPEQIRGMPVDARTDIFSTGIIIHEMLTTEKLFRGDTEFALMEKVRKADIPAPSKFNRRVNQQLDDIVMKALARNVDDRYQSAEQLRDDLNEILDGYRFDKRELKELIRKQFRGEWAKEQELQKRVMAPLTSADLDTEDEYEIETLDSSPSAQGTDSSGRAKRFSVPVPKAMDEANTPPPAQAPEAKKQGFWSRLVGRKK